MTDRLVLGFGLHFEDLYDREGLTRLDGLFLTHLTSANPELKERLCAARQSPENLAGKPESELIVELAPHLEDFTGELFGISNNIRALRARHDELAPIYSVKRLFVQRRAAKKFSPEEAATFDGEALRRELEAALGGELTELRFAQKVEAWMNVEGEKPAALDLAARYVAWAVHTSEGQRRHRAGVLFKLPHKLEPNHLVPVAPETVEGTRMLSLPPEHRRHEKGPAIRAAYGATSTA